MRTRILALNTIIFFCFSCLPGKGNSWLGTNKEKKNFRLSGKDNSNNESAQSAGEIINDGFTDAYNFTSQFLKDNEKEVIVLGSGASAILITATGLKYIGHSAFTSKVTSEKKLDQEKVKAAKANVYPDTLDFEFIQEKYKKSDYQALLIKNNDLDLKAERPLLFFYQGFTGKFSQSYERYFGLAKRLNTDLVVIDYTRAAKNSKQLVANMTELSQTMMKRLNAKPKNVTLYGYSVGAGVATQVAAEFHKLNQLVYLVADRGFEKLSRTFQEATRWTTRLKLPEAFFASILNTAGWGFSNKESWNRVDKKYKMAITTQDELIVRSNQLGGNDGTSRYEIEFPKNVKKPNHEASILQAVDTRLKKNPGANPSILGPIRDFHLKRIRL